MFTVNVTQKSSLRTFMQRTVRSIGVCAVQTSLCPKTDPHTDPSTIYFYLIAPSFRQNPMSQSKTTKCTAKKTGGFHAVLNPAYMTDSVGLHISTDWRSVLLLKNTRRYTEFRICFIELTGAASTLDIRCSVMDLSSLFQYVRQGASQLAPISDIALGFEPQTPPQLTPALGALMDPLAEASKTSRPRSPPVEAVSSSGDDEPMVHRLLRKAAKIPCTCSRQFDYPPRSGRHAAYCDISKRGAQTRVARLLATGDPYNSEIPRAQPAPVRSETLPLPTILPDIEDIIRFQPAIFTSVPSSARVAWGTAVRRVMEHLTTTDPSRWHYLFLLARIVLRKTDATQGAPGLCVAERCRRFCHAQFRNVSDMWTQAISEHQAQPLLGHHPKYEIDDPRPRHLEALDTSPPISERTRKRVTELASCGFYSRAVQALLPVNTATDTPEAVKALQALHPQGDPVVIPQLPAPAPPEISSAAVAKLIKGFNLGSSAGCTMLSPLHLREAVASSGTATLDAIARATGALLSSTLPPVVHAFIWKLCR
jgi:hypothetical protein